MKTEQIISELGNISSLPYIISISGTKGHFVILGNEICLFDNGGIEFQKIKSEYDFLCRVFNKNNLAETDKQKIARYIKNLFDYCGHLCSMQTNNDSPTDFLNKCSDVALKEIYTQIQMYKKAFEYYHTYKNHI